MKFAVKDSQDRIMVYLEDEKTSGEK